MFAKVHRNTPQRSPLEPQWVRLGLLLAPLVLAACQQEVAAPELPPNGRPQVTLTAVPDIVPAPLTVTLTAEASDPDGDALTYRWSIIGEGIEPEDFEGGAVETREFKTPGRVDVEVIVSDGELDSEPAAVTIQVLGPDAPEG